MARSLDEFLAEKRGVGRASYDANRERSGDAELSPMGQALMNAAVREANIMDAIDAGRDPFELLESRGKADKVVAKLEEKYAMQQRAGAILTEHGEATIIRLITQAPERVRALLAEYDKTQSREIDPPTVAALNAAEDRNQRVTNLAGHPLVAQSARVLEFVHERATREGLPVQQVLDERNDFLDKWHDASPKEQASQSMWNEAVKHGVLAGPEHMNEDRIEAAASTPHETANGRLDRAINNAVMRNGREPATGAYNRPAVGLLLGPAELTPSAKVAAVVDKLERKYQDLER